MGKPFFLGHKYIDKKASRERFSLDSEDLLTHVFVCGATGSGKTVLGKILIEEAALAGIPSILIDLKGDLSSLAVPLSTLDQSEIEPWVEARNAEERAAKAGQLLKFHKSNLVRSELLVDDVADFRRRADVRIYTPKSRLGTPLSLSPLSRPAFDAAQMQAEEREVFVNLVGNVADAIFERIVLEEERPRMTEERVFLEEIVSFLWMKGADLDGRKGFVELIRCLLSPPFDKIGVMKPADYLSDERRHALARRVNRLLVGAESLWYEGEPFAAILDGLAKPGDGRTPVCILNLSHLDTFEERNLVLSQIGYTIYSWMRKRIDWTGPRLFLYVDEIGGGGKHSFFPEEPHVNASKSALNLLLRQGRAFGVCLCLSTQNPGDIDYRGLTNCQTWFVGKLLTESDRAKIMQGLVSVNFLVKNFEEFVKTAEAGDFSAKLRGGELINFRERWLLTWHKVLTPDDYPLLRRRLRFTDASAEARALLSAGRADEALALAKTRLAESGADPDMLLLLADVAADAGDAATARGAYEKSLALRPTDTVCLRLGHLLLEAGDAAAAAARFRAGLAINPANEALHMELGVALERSGDPAAAEEAYQAATKANPNLDRAWTLRGDLLLSRRDGKEAAVCFTRALDVRPDCAAARTGLAAANHLLGQSIAALAELAAVLETDPAFRPALRRKAEVHHDLAEREEAVAAAQAFVAADEGDAAAHLLLGRMLAAAERHVEAVKSLRTAAKLRADDPEPWIELSDSLLAHGDPGNALTAARNGAKLARRSARALYRVALAERALGQNDEANGTLQEIAKSDPSWLPAWLDLADDALAAGRNEETVALIDRALKSHVGDERLLLRKADALLSAGNAKEALRILGVVKEIERAEPRVALLRAAAQHGTGQDMEALETLKEACQFFPDLVAPWRDRGKLLLAMKKHREASECYERALALDEGNAALWRDRGECLKGMFEDEEAQRCFARAAELEGSVP